MYFGCSVFLGKVCVRVCILCIVCAQILQIQFYINYSLRPTLGVPVEFGTSFKKYKGKLVKKDSGMWLLLLYTPDSLRFYMVLEGSFTWF